MKILLVAVFAILIFLLIAVAIAWSIKRQIRDVPKNYPTRDMAIKSLYICVYDMDRAIKFYEEFFEQQVTERDEIYSVFELYGFRFGLFAFEKKHEVHTFGSNCLPSVAMESVDLLNEKIAPLNVIFPLTQIGNNWVAEVEDSEGNHIEVTAPVR